ncbi:MAG: RecQ family zinc-binding domain-containing protein, partial [Pyrinomonadaceae bacterium]
MEKAGHIERGNAAENRASLRLLVTGTQARASVADQRSAQQRQVLFALLGGYELSERRESEIDTDELAETLGLDRAHVRRALAALSAAGILSYQPARRVRGLLMRDEVPVKQLRIRPQDLARRAALEQRKLREMISFCYTEDCYRTFILDYFGDTTRHADRCGSCGNCAPGAKTATERTARQMPAPVKSE